VAKKRTPIPDEVAALVMFEQGHRCCMCGSETSLQIHHIDENPSNNDRANLAVLCVSHHDEAHLRGGFTRKLSAAEIRLHRAARVGDVARARAWAIELSAKQLAGIDASRPKAITKPSAEFHEPPLVQLLAYLESLPETLRTRPPNSCGTQA
jgi:hypothetical protein